MGQLEKYGLYVLCLLIFLIFGVTLWGAPEVNAGRKEASGRQNAAQLASNGGDPGRANPNVGNPIVGNPIVGNPSGVGGGGDPIKMGDLFKTELPPAIGEGNKGKQGDKADPKKGGEAPGPDPKAVDPKAGDPKAGDPKIGDPKIGATPPAPVQRQTHRVVSGDSYTSIAIRYFKDATLAGEIARLNPKLNPLKLQVKTEVVLPTQEEVTALQNAKKAPKADASKGGDSKPVSAAVAGEDYEVRPGDTIEGISIRVYGSRNRVDDIKALNPSVSPTNMKVGARLKLPKK